jgi:hypothetical protein
MESFRLFQFLVKSSSRGGWRRCSHTVAHDLIVSSVPAAEQVVVVVASR